MVFPLHHTHGFHCYWADVWSKVAEPEGQGVRSCRDCTEMQGAEIRRRIMSDALNDRIDYLETYRFVFMGFGSLGFRELSVNIELRIWGKKKIGLARPGSVNKWSITG